MISSRVDQYSDSLDCFGPHGNKLDKAIEQMKNDLNFKELILLNKRNYYFLQIAYASNIVELTLTCHLGVQRTPGLFFLNFRYLHSEEQVYSNIRQ